MRFIVQILTNTLALFVADYLLQNFIFKGDILTLIIAGLILGLINFFIRPILKLISAPLILLSLGLFTLVINMALLWLLEYLIPELAINGIFTYFWATLIIAAVNIVLGTKTRKKKD